MKVEIMTTFGERTVYECDDFEVTDSVLHIHDEDGENGVMYPLNSIRRIKYDTPEEEDYWDGQN